jgi:uncharacterized membrane protein YfcA
MVNFLVGTALGFLSGLGVGGGTLLLLWMTLVLGADPDPARVMNLMFFLPCAAIATAFRWKPSKPDWHHILPAAVAGLLGAVIGNLLSPILPRDLLRKAFGVLFLLAGVREITWRPK